MTTINVYLRVYGKEQTKGIVWVSFYLYRSKVNFSMNVECEVCFWNKDKRAVLPGDKGAADKNLIIDRILARINDIFVKYRLMNKKLTKEIFIRRFNRPDDFDTFFDFVKDYMKQTSKTITMSTFTIHKTVIDKMKGFQPDLHFDDITTKWLDIYYAHLKKDLHNNQNTAYKNMTTIRKYVKAAYKAGYIEENPFEEWHIPRTKANYSYLNEDELQKFLNLYFEGSLPANHHKTLEFFLFMCFSSLHIGDAKKLRLEQFGTESFTYYRFKNRNKKPDPVVVPISEPLRKILYNIVGTRKKGLIFENLHADQSMNRELNKIGDSIELNKHISHKTGRHTFATIFLRKTKDLTTLKEILGHSALSETLIYAHVLDESKQDGIKIFNSFTLGAASLTGVEMKGAGGELAEIAGS